MVNFKSITADDKERTPPDEYVNRIYAALNDNKLDRNYIVAQVAPTDIELKDWLTLVTKAETAVTEGSILGEMRWEMVKASALYHNNNLALTGIEARSTSLSSGHPTVEAKFILKSRGGREIIITGSAASGASAGNREALFLFDKDFAKKAEKQPDLLTDEMIKGIYGKGVDRKEALKRLKTNYEGKGVEITLWIARNVLIPELTKAIKEGKVDPTERYSVDRFMRKYEKTHGGNERQKLKLTGGNTTAFSTAAAKLGAAFNNMAPWEFLAYRPNPNSLEINYESFEVLIPIAVLIEGGEHGNWNTDWQEYMVEVRGDSLEEIALKLKNITFALDKIIQKRGDKIGVGLESGYLPTLTSTTEPIEMIVQAGKNAGYIPGKDFAVALDCAASEFYKEYNGKYYYWYSLEGKNNKQISLASSKKIGKIVDIQKEDEEMPGRFLLLTSEEELEYALDVCKNPKFYISSVEDFFDQNDLWGNKMLTRTLQDKDFIAGLPHEFQRKDGIRQDAISHVADDFTTSNIDVVRAGIDGGTVIFEGEKGKEELVLEKDSVDAVLLKLNQAGTIQEVMELVEYLRSRGRTIAHSHRGKEPSKETIRADVALASTTYPSTRHDRTGAPARVKIKYGTIRKERAVVYDYLLEAYEKIRRKLEEAKIKAGNIQAQDPVVVAEVKGEPANPPSTFIDTGGFIEKEVGGPRKEKQAETENDTSKRTKKVAREFNIPEEKAADFTKKLLDYRNAEKAGFTATGGGQFSDLVNTINKAWRADRKEGKKLKISAELGEQGGYAIIKVKTQYGKYIVDETNFYGSFPESNDAVINWIAEINRRLSYEEFDLRKEEDIKAVKEYFKVKDINHTFQYTEQGIGMDIVKALDKLRQELLKQDIIIRAVETRAIIVDAADYFNTPGAAYTLLEALRLAGDNFKIGIFGKGAAKLKILLGGSDNIIIAETQVEVGRELVGRLDIKPSNIKFVRAGNTPTITMAATLYALYITNETEKAFNDFYQAITEAKVITAQEYENTKGLIYTAIAKTRLDESGRILAVELPEIELTEAAQNAINAGKQAVTDFMATIGV